VIQADPQLSAYEAAIDTRPELVELINGTEVVTVFAPTNAAVAEEPTWDAIVADPTAFENFVRSHIVAGALTTEQLFTGTEPRELTTLSGQTITVDPVARTINGASIVTRDTPGTNGVVQTIDQLLIVPTVTPTTAPTSSGTSTTSPG
jgi:uncharacterized surface protein with fasciclin (FAS1) repeats